MSENENKTTEMTEMSEAPEVSNRTAPEGVAYDSALLPEDEPLETVQGRTPSRSRAQTVEELYGKRLNIGMLIPIESLDDLLAFHGIEAVEAFIEKAVADFRQRLEGAIADHTGGSLKEHFKGQRDARPFDIMRTVYGSGTIDEAHLEKVEGIEGMEEGEGAAEVEVDGKRFQGVPGYHWTVMSGDLYTDLVKAEIEGGPKAVMQRISEMVETPS